MIVKTMAVIIPYKASISKKKVAAINTEMGKTKWLNVGFEFLAKEFLV